MASFKTFWRRGHVSQRQGGSLNDETLVPKVRHRAAASHSPAHGGQVVASIAGGVASRFAHGAVHLPGSGSWLSAAVGRWCTAGPGLAWAPRVASLCGPRLSPFVAAAPVGSWPRSVVAGLCARSRAHGAFGAPPFSAALPFALRPALSFSGFASLRSWVTVGFRFGHLTPRCSGPQGWPSAIPVAAELER